MPTLSPTTLTTSEQRTILRATAKNTRDHTIYSLAVGTGLRLGEIVGLNVGDVFNGNGRPRTRIRIRPEIAKRGKAGDVFLPDKLVAKLREMDRTEQFAGALLIAFLVLMGVFPSVFVDRISETVLRLPGVA